MHKKLLSGVVILALSILLIIPSQVVDAASFNQRLYGQTRYETAVKIAQHGWTTSQYAVIASGEGFADALSAAPLAKKYDAPILLTGKNTLDSNVRSELQSLSAKNVFIIGGTGSVSSNVESQLKSMNITVTRISGTDRFETSLEVARNLGDNITGIVVVNAYGFADALSIAPIAASKGMPIILTAQNSLNDKAEEFLSNIDYEKSYIIGGTSSVGTAVSSQLKNCIRLGGNTRYETNASVLKQFADEFNYDKVYVASGQNYPDALSGSVLAAKYNSPLILAANSVDDSVLDAINLKHDLYKDVIAFGGLSILPDSVISSIVRGNASEPSSEGERQVLGTAKDLGAGTFTGGKDIQPGLYDVTPIEGFGNFIVEGNDWKLYTNEILGNSYGYGVEKVRASIENGDNIQLAGISKAHFEPVTTPFATKVEPLSLYSGTWKVGEDIAPSRYKATVSKGTGNFIIYDANGLIKINEILNGTSDLNMGVKETTIDLSKGDIIKISGLNQVDFIPSN